MRTLTLIILTSMLALGACGKKKSSAGAGGQASDPGLCVNSRLSGVWAKASVTFTFGSDCSYSAVYASPSCSEKGSYKDHAQGTTSGPVDITINTSTCDSADNGQTFNYNYVVAPGGLILN
jgi:hypothetical protein